MTEKTTPRAGVKRLIGIDFDFGALRTAGPRYWAFVSLVLTVIGLGVMAWAAALNHGGSVMAMRDSYPWGLWFTNYMYYIGLSAGGLVVYASVHLFGAKQFEPLSRLAVLQAGVLVMMALLGIITDMERPWRAIYMLLTPNPSSPFIYTGSAANIYMIICFVDLWILITGKGGHKLAHRMTLIALPFAVYLHTTTAFVLALNKSRELWNSAVMVPIFLTSATASGIALLLIVARIMQHFRVMEFKKSMFRSLSTLLATVIITDLFLLAVEILTVFWPTSARPGHTIRFANFFTGEYALAFLPVLMPDGVIHPIFANVVQFFPTKQQPEPRQAGLPLLDGCTRIAGAKPGATVLAVHPGEGNMPVLATQPVGKGRSAVFIGDTTRKWQQGPRALNQDSPFLQFWGQMVRWLAGWYGARGAGRMIGPNAMLIFDVEPLEIVKE